MGETLRKRIRQPKFDSPVQEAILNVLVAAGHLRERVGRICAGHGISHTQYNVLRILRGGPPDGYPRHEIQCRMVERAPDVTRLIDRLIMRGYVERTRTGRDRRLSVTRITPAGVELLAQLTPKVQAMTDDYAKRIDQSDCRELSRICESLYSVDD